VSNLQVLQPYAVWSDTKGLLAVGQGSLAVRILPLQRMTSSGEGDGMRMEMQVEQWNVRRKHPKQESEAHQ